MDNVVAFRSAAHTDTLADFAETWFDQVSIGWRDTTQRRIASILNCHVLPEFHRHGVDGFDRAALMAYRARLVREGRCTPDRANAVMQVASQCLTERERQRGVANPCAICGVFRFVGPPSSRSPCRSCAGSSRSRRRI